MRDSVVFYRSFREAIKKLSPAEQLKAYDAILDYALDGIEPEMEGIASAIWIMAKPQIDANNKRHENGKKGAEYGVLGGRPKKDNPTETPKKPQENPTETPNENVNVNVNENVNENVKEKRARFTPPALDEVKEYCKERQNNVDPERFIDFYASKGWKVGNQSMKDWKACVRTWEKKNDRASPNNKVHFQLERKYDIDSIEQTLLNKRRSV